MDPTAPVALSSPLATGGDGTAFEQRVDAAFLALLLVNGPVPFLGTASLHEVHLQTAHLGWATDDLLLVGTLPDERKRRVAVQVKRDFAITRTNVPCRETFKRAWQDFHDDALFDQAEDRLGVVTGAASQKLLRGFRSLLDAAKASVDAADFKQRLTHSDYLPKAAKEYAAIIREIVQPDAPDGFDDEFVDFLKRIDFASLDLDGASPTVSLIRGLLASHALDESGTSDSWSELVRFASESAPRAQSILRDQLPDDLRTRFRSSPARSTKTVGALNAMTDIVWKGASRHIADHHINRPSVAQDLFDAMDSHDIVLVVGGAGAGKSAVVAEVFETLRQDTLALAIRAEQLAASHLAEALAPQDLNVERLSELFALHPRRVAWVESVERLLETDAEQRAAFPDFLRLTSEFPGWKLIITCRDYQVDVVRSAFFDATDHSYGIVRVSPLTNDELDGVAAAVPRLARPLASPQLRELLRVPFVLASAARLDWDGDAPVPETLVTFRRKVWQELVRKEDEQADGFPSRRSAAFVAVAIKRARRMTPYVATSELEDKAALHRLARDGLLAVDPTRDDWFTPAHDVLEDWAVLQWIEQQFDSAEEEWTGFLSRLGAEPAIRRTVRLWIAEHLSGAPADSGADGRILATVVDRALQPHWRDDLLVGVLVSAHAETFLRRNRGVLLADGAWLLRNVLHLVRVACRRLPEHQVVNSGFVSIALIPDGPAWAVLAEFLADRELAESVPSSFALAFRFVEAWFGGVREDVAYPSGSQHVAVIANRLLKQTDELDYHVREHASRFLIGVIFSLPLHAQDEIDALSEQEASSDRNNHGDDVRAVVLSHFSGVAVSRERPDLVFRVLEHAWGADAHEDGDEEMGWLPRSSAHDPDKMELAFAFPRHSRLDHFPASAFQGPWSNLLHHHPTETFAVLIRQVNRVCRAYAASPRGLERASELAVRSAEGAVSKLWGNSRLYCLYRGTSVGPYGLQSALMALERWLLARGAAGDPTLSQDLERLVRETNNVALASVVISVATAYPVRAGKAALTFLTCPGFFDLERGRWVHDRTSPSRFREYTSGDPMDRVLAKERVDSAKLPHRAHDLEDLCLLLQMTEARDEVWKIIDTHRAELPEPESQTDDQKMWRLVLHRCDLRHFEESPARKDGGVAYRSSPPAADIKLVLDSHDDAIAEMNTESRLFVWANSVFRSAQDPGNPSADWEEMMALAREQEHSRTALRGPGPVALVAAACARDHWQVMNSESRAWCFAKMDAATRDADPTSYRTVVDGAREAGRVLPLLASHDPEEVDPLLLDAVLRAFTHSEEDVQLYAAAGIGQDLWPRDPRLGRGLVMALIEFTRIERGRYEREEVDEDRATESAICRAAVRPLLEGAGGEDLCGPLQLDYHRPPWSFIVKPLCALFRYLPDEECSRSFFAHVFEQLTTAWAKEGTISNPRPGSDGFHPALEHRIVDHLSAFSLQLAPSEADRILKGISRAVASHTEKVESLTKYLIIAQLGRDDCTTFWHLWQRIANALVENTSIKRMRGRRSGDAKLAQTLLLSRIQWGGDAPSWSALEGEEHRLVALFGALPPSAEVLAAFVRFLHKFGSAALPDALGNIAAKLSEPWGTEALSSNAASWLEVVLGRLVYSGYPGLRARRDIREATISILDSLVDSGSSAAYRIRDDFLTPIRSRTSETESHSRDP